MKIIKLMLVFYTDNTHPRLETLKQTVSKRFKQATILYYYTINYRKKYPFIEFLKAPGK